jgi:hypothetical protein
MLPYRELAKHRGNILRGAKESQEVKPALAGISMSFLLLTAMGEHLYIRARQK